MSRDDLKLDTQNVGVVGGELVDGVPHAAAATGALVVLDEN